MAVTRYWDAATSSWIPLGAAYPTPLVSESPPPEESRSKDTLWVDTTENTVPVTTNHNDLQGLEVGDPHPQYTAAIENATTVVQVVHGSTSSPASTTSTSWENTTLQASITPKYADSILVVETFGWGDANATGSASITHRYGQWRIRNDTDGVVVSGSSVRHGRSLTAASTAAASSWFAAFTKGAYTVDSTAARTFFLQFAAPIAGVQVRLLADQDPASMRIWEVRP